MCIIAVKPRGQEMLSEEIINNCFNHNKDGAGFMYFNKDGKINIEKGYMTLLALKGRLKEMNFQKEDIVVFHFRIGTSGGNIAGNTHPFPITNEVEQLKATFVEGLDMAMAHNGVIPIKREIEDNNDTQEFIRTKLSNPDVWAGLRYHKKSAHKVITKAASTSRFCILTVDGKFTLLGSGWTTDRGIIYSNASYKTRTYTTYEYKSTKDWEDEYDRKHGYGCGDWQKGNFRRGSGNVIDLPARPKDYFLPTGEKKETKEDIMAREIARDEEQLREIFMDFLDVFFLAWHGEDTKFNLKHAFEVGFEAVKDSVMSIEKGEKGEILY